MRARIKSHLSYANVMASIAVFVVLGGGAYAAIERKIATKDIRKSAVTTPKIAKQAIKTGKIADQAITRKKLADGVLGKGFGATPGSRALYISVQQGEGARTGVTFDAPWSVILGTGDEGIGVVSPGPGGGELTSGLVSVTSTGAMEFAVAGGSGAITGTASVPPGATATIQVDDSPTQALPNGKFSIGG